jgi:hypothetical protein
LLTFASFRQVQARFAIGTPISDFRLCHAAVTRMLSLATIKERINEALEHKRSSSPKSSARTPPPSSGLSQAEIFGLFNLRMPKGVIQPAA